MVWYQLSNRLSDLCALTLVKIDINVIRWKKFELVFLHRVWFTFVMTNICQKKINYITHPFTSMHFSCIVNTRTVYDITTHELRTPTAMVLTCFVWNIKLFCTRALFQYKDGLSRYGDFHYKDKTVMRPYYLYNGNTYIGKMVSLYWDSLQKATLVTSISNQSVWFER